MVEEPFCQFIKLLEFRRVKVVHWEVVVTLAQILVELFERGVEVVVEEVLDAGAVLFLLDLGLEEGGHVVVRILVHHGVDDVEFEELDVLDLFHLADELFAEVLVELVECYFPSELPDEDAVFLVDSHVVFIGESLELSYEVGGDSPQEVAHVNQFDEEFPVHLLALLSYLVEQQGLLLDLVEVVFVESDLKGLIRRSENFQETTLGKCLNFQKDGDDGFLFDVKFFGELFAVDEADFTEERVGWDG